LKNEITTFYFTKFKDVWILKFQIWNLIDFRLLFFGAYTEMSFFYFQRLFPPTLKGEVAENQDSLKGWGKD